MTGISERFARRLLLGLIPGLLGLLTAGQTLAAHTLAPVVGRMIEAAARRDAEAGGDQFLTTAVILAIDADREAAREIIAALRSHAPDRADAVLVATQSAVPDLAPVMVQIGAPPPLVTTQTPADAAKSGPLGRLGVSGEVQGGGSLTSGNTDERAFSTALKLGLDRGEWEHALGVNFDFTRTLGTTTKQRFVADYQLDYKFSRRAYLFGYLQYEDDKFSGFDFRTSESGGVGYRLIASERLDLDIEGGPALRQDKIQPAGAIENEFGGRLKAALEWKIGRASSLSHASSMFVGSARSTFDTTTALKVAVNNSLSGRVSYSLQWDSNVPEGKTEVDTITRFTLVYDF